ncbi:D-alanyl-D-alanine carboxypeptidase family protein [Facilibium subflavum]|uniref:D-alanyl-D-alanine carboxypeptidase family protein n=1 Tax=Facilibium subflavum TaxID=2219058 RepID=UPI0013C2E065|nr:D-alanyl-D-alanine carboxypeptidase family protein [Facilibium subflavum]
MARLKKLTLLALSAATVFTIQPGIADSQNTDAAKTQETYGAASVNYMGVPLNPYGAVSSSANVPLDVQVPPAPEDLKLPAITPATTLWQGQVVRAPMLNVKSYLLVDAQTGNVLAAKEPNKRIAPASLTKMMLLYIVEQRLASGSLKLNQEVTVPPIAWHTAGSSMHLKAGQKVSIQDLLEGTIVASGNDAAVTLSMVIAGTQEGFVNIMNYTAQKLGMNNTHFSDVMGLPAPNLYTSAYDLAILARHLIYDFPQYYKYFKMKEVTMNGFITQNYNKLLNIYPYADGIKTGSTDSAGYSLVASAVKPDHDRLISVVLGSTSLIQSARDSQTLLEYGFSNFKTKVFYPANYRLGQIRVYKGENDYSDIGVGKEIAITYPRDVDPKDIQFVLHKNPDGLVAPVKAGAKAGTLDMTYKGKTKMQFDVVVLQNNDTGSLWQRIKGTVALWF